MVNWTQIHNQSVTAIVYRGLSHMLHFREEPQTGLSSFLHRVRAFWANPCERAPRMVFQPIGLRLSLSNGSCATIIFICIFTNQSEQLYSNESGQCFLDQSHSEDLESSFAREWASQRPGAKDSFYISHLTFNLESALSLSMEHYLSQIGAVTSGPPGLSCLTAVLFQTMLYHYWAISAMLSHN